MRMYSAAAGRCRSTSDESCRRQRAQRVVLSAEAGFPNGLRGKGSKRSTFDFRALAPPLPAALGRPLDGTHTRLPFSPSCALVACALQAGAANGPHGPARPKFGLESGCGGHNVRPCICCGHAPDGQKAQWPGCNPGRSETRAVWRRAPKSRQSMQRERPHLPRHGGVLRMPSREVWATWSMASSM